MDLGRPFLPLVLSGLALLYFDLASRAADPEKKPAILPIEFVRGQMMVKATVNTSSPLTFMLDTGYGINTLHPDVVKNLELKRVGRITIVGIAGEEEAGQYSGAVYDFGGLSYGPRRVASLPSEAERRRRRDGILGSGFFRRFVVEIDPQARTVKLSEPDTFDYTGSGEIIPIEMRDDTPTIEAVLIAPDESRVRARFDVDTGCDDNLCLGHDFVTAHHLDTSEAPSGNRSGVGGGARVRAGHVPRLELGSLKVENPTANFFLDGSPTSKDLAGHIGLAALRHFKMIFDLSRHRLILEKLN